MWSSVAGSSKKQCFTTYKHYLISKTYYFYVIYMIFINYNILLCTHRPDLYETSKMV